MSDDRAQMQQVQKQQQEMRSKLEPKENAIDYEHLNWFENKLISSWSDSTVRARIVYLHHSLYTTEATRYSLEETCKVRYHYQPNSFVINS